MELQHVTFMHRVPSPRFSWHCGDGHLDFFSEITGSICRCWICTQLTAFYFKCSSYWWTWAAPALCRKIIYVFISSPCVVWMNYKIIRCNWHVWENTSVHTFMKKRRRCVVIPTSTVPPNTSEASAHFICQTISYIAPQNYARVCSPRICQIFSVM